jgi:hypothetical protein
MENDVLLFHKFIEAGLVPEDSILDKNRENFKARMESLSIKERRSAKRKFRKLFRKSLKKEIRKILDSEAGRKIKIKRISDLKESCGFKNQELLPRHLNRRRFLVRSFLLEEI